MPLIPKVGRRKLKIRFLLISITGILWIGVAIHLFPVWWMFITSIKSSIEVYQFPPTLWPERPTFVVYKMIYVLSAGTWGAIQEPIYVYFKNSLIMTGGIMIIQIPLAALIAYSISKLHSPQWSRLVFLYAIGLLMVPGTIRLIPQYLVMRHFPIPTLIVPKIPFTNTKIPTYNFLNTYWAVILPSTFSAFNVLLFKGFFDGIPDELINAARLDGASEFGIFRRIILPISKPVFAVITYFSFTMAWNQFLWPLLVLKDNSLYPIAILLYNLQNALQSPGLVGHDPGTEELLQQGIGMNAVMGISIIQSIPVFIMFIVFREQLMRGIKIRGLK